MKTIYLCVLGVLILEACETKNHYQSDIKAFRTDIKSIRGWLENYMEAIRTADIERILSYESDDISYLPPNQQLFSGKENLRKWFLSYFNYFTPTERLDLLDFKVFGEFAYLKGSYTISGKIKQSGEEVSDKGKFINFFKRKSDGNWICTQSIWNSDNRSYDIHSQIPADFSGRWKLDISKSTALPNILGSTLVISQKGNDITINKTYEKKDNDPVIGSFQYRIGDELKSLSRTGSLTTTSFWNANRQTLTTIETLISERTGFKLEYKRTTVYYMTANGEVLNAISDDTLPKDSLTPPNERHKEMVYIKL